MNQWQQARRELSVTQALLHLMSLYLEITLLNTRLSKDANDDRAQQLRFWFPHVNFSKLRILDLLRIPLQVLWLMFFRFQVAGVVAEPPRAASYQKQLFKKQSQITSWLSAKWRLVIKPFYEAKAVNIIRAFGDVTRYGWLNTALLRILFTILAALLVAFTVTLPLDAAGQAIMLLFFWVIAVWVRDVQRRGALLMMVVLSIVVSTRYLYWRVTSTINWDDAIDTLFSMVLLCAEVYAWLILVLGYVQTIWPLSRKVAALPTDTSIWPSVDIYIPSYNEPLYVVRPTVLAALAIDWPKDKLNVYLLDDGRRTEFAEFAASIGAGYIIRKDNSHAKAGNLNHALKVTQGDYIAIFDCDHIPTRSFLQLTMGWFAQEPKLALVQTPHHFFSQDPFEKNLSVFRSKPNEGELFYGLIQDGNDMWNSSFFCGSCAVLKRGPLEEVGGVATETVTEDAHTALKMHRLGYTSAYLNIPQAAGLATESLSAHIGQRIRWARGMAQIFRLDNPLFGKGLSFAQRICYSNAMLYFLNGLPRLIFILAPLAFLLLHSYIVFAPAIMIALYAAPHIVHSYMTSSRTQGKFRHSFWAEMYETVLAWYIMRPTLVALFAPRRGKFNVTAKGGFTPKAYFDWSVSTPYIVLVALCLFGFGFGVWRLITGPTEEYLTVILNLVWVIYNLIILGGAVAVAEEAKQVRVAHRVKVKQRSVAIITQSEHVYEAQLIDYSDRGIGLQVKDTQRIKLDDKIRVVMKDGTTDFAFNATIVSCRGTLVGALLQVNSVAEQQALLRATFSRADAWVGWRHDDYLDRPMTGFSEVVLIGLRGYRRLLLQITPKMEPVLRVLAKCCRFIRSLLPHVPGEKVSNV